MAGRPLYQQLRERLLREYDRAALILLVANIRNKCENCIIYIHLNGDMHVTHTSKTARIIKR